MDDFKLLPLAAIHDPFHILRPVDKDSLDYIELHDSIRDIGFLNSVSVRPSPRQPSKFETIDGTYRVHCARDLSLESVPCIIKHGMSDADVLAFQTQANAIRPKTTPLQFSKQLKKILDMNPGMTHAQLAVKIRKRARWVSERLGLVRLDDDMQLMIERGEIPLQSAYMLAKIHKDSRRDLLTQAQTMTGGEFQQLARQFIKEFAEGLHREKLDHKFTRPFAPQAHMKSVVAVQKELEHPSVGATILVSEGAKSPMDGWNLCLQWVLHIDPAGLDGQRSNHLKKELKRKIH